MSAYLVRSRSRRLRRGGEGGYVLAVVLGLLLTVALIAAVLLGSTMNSTTLIGKENVNARQERAANGVLEAAVNQIRMDPTGSLGSQSPCDPGLSTLDVGPVEASVQCEVVPSDPPAPDVASTISGASNRLTVVGGSYSGAVPWTTDCPIGGGGAAPGPGCFPWKAAMGPANFGTYKPAVDASSPTFVHSGPEPFKITGGMSVKAGAAVLRNPTSDGPGLEVGGAYVQGASGLLNSVGGGPCGLLGMTHPWNLPSARVIDGTAGPECGSSTAAALGPWSGLDAPALQFSPTPNQNAWMPSGIQGIPGGLTPSPIGDQAKTVPACSGQVLQFEPGSYNEVETAKLNAYWSSGSDGNCDGRTFWFKPGDYWFDSANADNSITINDPGGKVIFGALSRAAVGTTGAVPGDYPRACDPSLAGVSISLSPRTSWRHLNGRVAICDRDTTSDAGTRPALWQTAGADGGWLGYVSGVTSWSSRNTPLVGSYSTYAGQNPDGAQVPGDGSVASAYGGCTGLFCTGDATLTVTGLGAKNSAGAAQMDPGRAPINSAQLLIVGDANDLNDMATVTGSQPIASTKVEVFLRDGSGAIASTPSCGGKYRSINESPPGVDFTVRSLDLIRDQPEGIGIPLCRDVLIDRGQLYNATVRLTFHTNTDGDDNRWLEIDGVGIRAGWYVTPGSAPQGTFENPSAVGAPDGIRAKFSLQCSLWAWDGCPTGTKSITLPALNNYDVPNVPTSILTSATVLIQGGESDGGTFGLTLTDQPEIWDNSRVTLRLTNLGGGGQCALKFKGPPAWGQTQSFDLMGSTGETVSGFPRCSTALTSSRQLVGASLTVDVYLQRDGWAILDQFGVLIDYIGLSTTSAGYEKPTAINTMRVDAAGSSDGASFNVYGPVSTPRNAWDVHWAGPATDDPVVSGNMVVGSLGSDMAPSAKTGTFCCAPGKPSERRVLLSAYVNGNLRGSAIARISDQDGGVYSPGRAAVIEEWRICRQPSAQKRCPDQ